ncbi:MAG: hypothetical protein COB78_10840 [Hyphomicrobiales bacterium]|nr:MAG: hypothetical protein COB78_10840 [Hyphomicrobiales bacterium]
MANTQKDVIFSICVTPQPADLNKAGFEALTFVSVSNVGNLGETGKSENILTYNTLDTAVAQKAKGVADAGNPTVECARLFSDPGQVALNAAAATNLQYAFKIERNDSPDGILTNTIIYNRGLVTGPTRPNGGNEDFDLEVFTLALNQLEVVVDPETP